jgi:hypothetical protein
VDHQCAALTSANGLDQPVKHTALGAAAGQPSRVPPRGRVSRHLHRTHAIPWPAHYPSWLPAGGFDHRAAAAGLNSARLTAAAGRSYDRTRREPAADGGEPGMEQKWQPSTTATRP